MSGTECYHSLKNNLRDSWAEINEVIADGAIEINPGQNIPVQVEMFLGGDYKVMTLNYNTNWNANSIQQSC